MSPTESNPFAEPDFSGIEVPEDADSETEDEFDDADDDGGDDFDDEADGDEDVDGPDDGDDAEGEPAGAAAEPVEAGNANVAPGGTAAIVLDHVARAIVDDPEGVVVDVSEGRSGVRLSLHVTPGDMGRVIGRRGRTAQALRTLVRAAAARDGQEASVDIVD